MYLARELTEHSPREIGAAIGGRNHTHRDCTPSTARHRRSMSDQVVRNAVENLRRRLAHPAS